MIRGSARCCRTRDGWCRRGVEADTEVDADDEETEVVAEPHAGADGNAFHVAQGESRFIASGIGTKEPHVTGIEEEGTVELSEESGAKFGVGFELEVAGLVDVGVFSARGVVAAGTDGAYGKTADGVGTTDVELLTVGGVGAVAECVDGTGKGTHGQTEARREDVGVVLGGDLDKLREGRSQEPLSAFGEATSCQ